VHENANSVRSAGTESLEMMSEMLSG